METKNRTLNQIAKNLDISPSDYKRAQERFLAVKNWLDLGEYTSGIRPEVYLQGSFRLGTVVRPYIGDKDGDFDIDQVCEISLPKEGNKPEVLKNDIGDRLKENTTYERMLDKKEGKRCWTIEYASEDNAPGFHIDILPAIPSKNGYHSQIDITDKKNNQYSWSISNPKGYYQWFKSKNAYPDGFIESKSIEIFESNRDVYSNIDDVPKQLVRSPLQRSIQIMKRHRDICFFGKKFKPISIIITTIATSVKKEDDIFGIINDFVKYVIDRHDSIIRYGYLDEDEILDYVNFWEIPNPVDKLNGAHKVENFADKWNVKEELPKAFFEWVYQLKRDLEYFNISGSSDDLNLHTKSIGEQKSYPSIIKKSRTNSFGTNDLLKLIHLGIEGKLEWERVKKISEEILEKDLREGNADVAKINYYQIGLHSGSSLLESAIEDIKDIYSRNLGSPAFKMCCHILLGTVTQDMIKKCVQDYSIGDVLSWPIMRLLPYNLSNLIVKGDSYL